MYNAELLSYHLHFNTYSVDLQREVGYCPTATPYILDPANAFNNLYISGIGLYVAGSTEGTYEPGDGNWTLFVRNIDKLDLTQAV